MSLKETTKIIHSLEDDEEYHYTEGDVTIFLGSKFNYITKKSALKTLKFLADLKEKGVI